GMPINVAVFSPDGRLVLTGASDGTARLWDVRTGRAVGAPYRHSSRVVAAAFSHDGRHFATAATAQGGARLWGTPTPDESRPAEVMLRSELLTGLSFEESGEPIVLTPDAWAERRERLKP